MGKRKYTRRRTACQHLRDSYEAGTGCRLSADEVVSLFLMDTAMTTLAENDDMHNVEGESPDDYFI